MARFLFEGGAAFQQIRKISVDVGTEAESEDYQQGNRMKFPQRGRAATKPNHGDTEAQRRFLFCPAVVSRPGKTIPLRASVSLWLDL